MKLYTTTEIADLVRVLDDAEPCVLWAGRRGRLHAWTIEPPHRGGIVRVGSLAPGMGSLGADAAEDREWVRVLTELVNVGSRFETSRPPCRRSRRSKRGRESAAQRNKRTAERLAAELRERPQPVDRATCATALERAAEKVLSRLRELLPWDAVKVPNPPGVRGPRRGFLRPPGWTDEQVVEWVQAQREAPVEADTPVEAAPEMVEMGAGHVAPPLRLARARTAALAELLELAASAVVGALDRRGADLEVVALSPGLPAPSVEDRRLVAAVAADVEARVAARLSA